MRIAVTGTRGQVVCSLLERGPAHGVDIVAVGRPALDLAEPASIHPALAAARPDVIVNAAAYTAVDRAESEPELATAINCAGAGAVASAACTLGVPLIQISTDYVFDGSSARSYREDDQTAPLGAYGRSKLAGERAVAERSADHAILRTAWIYSPFGANFVKTMLRLAAGRNEIAVVADQAGAPTSALDIADGVIAVAENLLKHSGEAALRGVFHMTGSGEANWAEFARAVFEASATRGGPGARVRPITTAEYPTPARRPANSRLDCGKLAQCHGVVLPAWRGSVESCVARILAESHPTPGSAS
ncbi:MAG: dTDP-4-dehydrorhamnose reductase [Methylobacteriaceae bacterium]|nr:dTDP-4-dehydrorhamnose reductase [Methylobacteriaceae bacterium]